MNSFGQYGKKKNVDCKIFKPIFKSQNFVYINIIITVKDGHTVLL